jgi:hypothetical protein
MKECKKNTVEQDRTQMTVQYDAENVRFSCRISKAKRKTETYNI